MSLEAAPSFEYEEETFGWILSVPQDGVGGDSHIVPGGDIREHEPSEVCWCNPTLIDHPQVGMCLQHKALDNREVYLNGKKMN